MRTIQTVELDLVQEQTGIRRPIGAMAGVANSVWRVVRIFRPGFFYQAFDGSEAAGLVVVPLK